MIDIFSIGIFVWRVYRSRCSCMLGVRVLVRGLKGYRVLL